MIDKVLLEQFKSKTLEILLKIETGIFNNNKFHDPKTCTLLSLVLETIHSTAKLFEYVKFKERLEEGISIISAPCGENRFFSDTELEKFKEILLSIGESIEDYDQGQTQKIESLKVLIVDDNKPIHKLIALMFDDFYELNHAYNGQEAFDMIGEFIPDILLSDVKMPVMDGLELLQKVMISYPDLPVIIMTAHADKDLLIESINEGAFHFIEKPFGEEHLKEAIEDARAQKLRKYINFSMKLLSQIFDQDSLNITS